MKTVKGKFIVNSKELLLLCAMRGCAIKVRNNTVYSWTFKHHNYEQERSLSLGPRFFEKMRQIQEEASKEFETKKRKERNFFAKLDKTGITLWEIDNDLCWYEPKAANSSMQWHYKGSFTILDPVSTMEKCALNTYCK